MVSVSQLFTVILYDTLILYRHATEWDVLPVLRQAAVLHQRLLPVTLHRVLHQSGGLH